MRLLKTLYTKLYYFEGIGGRMFCSQCGKPILDGSRFCSYCGSKIVLVPGNLTEPLLNPDELFTACQMAQLDQACLPEFGSLKEAREWFERAYIHLELKRQNGNMTKCAESLGLDRSNLYKLLKKKKNYQQDI